ncbi:ABC transporter ATP-binding protein [Thermaerobacter sp. PB12/4term]|uniref:ABC transporter ATP-binding protein n=1 Tax=Thermaerobacter sp. PB12/4term TaxID=2293838 RepID=UPI000E3294D9|nr:ABC transporter ATP-binding protein [Thermaerobacter sp. PB12/4term]QIA27697.1 ABC transporter ATP-binding protein [Thermaerobacter sp. PB12/4term]
MVIPSGTPAAARGVELYGVSKSFDGGTTWAVRQLTWRVEPGRITGLLGPNGAGKTTTLRVIAGILPPDAGTVRVDGINLAQRPLDAKRRIGLVPDGAALYDRMKGTEFLRFLADVYGVPDDERTRRMEELGRRLGIGSWVRDPIASYSTGMRQRLLLVGSLLHDPAVWILDEPMTGLDPDAQRGLKDLMAERRARGGTVLLTTHLLDVAERLCDRVAILHRGRLLAEGSPAALRRRFLRDPGDEPARRDAGPPRHTAAPRDAAPPRDAAAGPGATAPARTGAMEGTTAAPRQAGALGTADLEAVFLLLTRESETGGGDGTAAPAVGPEPGDGSPSAPGPGDGRRGGHGGDGPAGRGQP